jgi:hypothetical protein
MQPPAIGTPEYTNYLVQQGSNLGMNLDRFKVPTTAGQGTSVAPLQLPQLTPTTGNISNASAGITGLKTLYEEEAKNLDKEREQAVKVQKEGQSAVSKFLSSTPSISEQRKELQDEAGLDTAKFYAEQNSRIAEIGKLEEEYNKIVAARDTELAGLQENGQMTTEGVRVGSIAVERRYAIRLNQMSANINSKTANLEARQGNFDKAQNYIDQAIQDATYDTKFKLDTFSMFYDMNQDTISRLDSQYQDAMDKAFTLTREQHEADVRRAETLAEWSLKYGVDLDMNSTLESAASKLVRMGVTEDSNRFTTTQLNKGAVNAGLELDQFTSLDPEVQNFYISSSAAYLKSIQEAMLLEDAEQKIQDSNLPDVVKAYLISRIPANQKTEQKSFIQNAWKGVTNWLGGRIYDSNPDYFNR